MHRSSAAREPVKLATVLTLARVAERDDNVAFVKLHGGCQPPWSGPDAHARASRDRRGPGCAKVFVCRYHGWTYDLEGALRHVPHEDGFPGLRRDGTPAALDLGADLVDRWRLDDLTVGVE